MAIRLSCVGMSVLILGGVTACAPGSPEAAEPTLSTTPTGLPAGTPLVETLRTPLGALLRGQVFPHESGATALMLVTGDPLRVWSDLVEQAAQAGFG